MNPRYFYLFFSYKIGSPNGPRSRRGKSKFFVAMEK